MLKYESFLNFFRKRNDDTSESVNMIKSVISGLNDIKGVDVKFARINHKNDANKLKVIFSISLEKNSTINFLNELSNINSHLEDDDFISNLWILNDDDDGDGRSGHIINLNNWEYIFREKNYIVTEPADFEVPGLYLIVKRKSIKSNYIF